MAAGDAGFVLAYTSPRVLQVGVSGLYESGVELSNGENFHFLQ
jgi:hypothetical protein